MEGELLAVIGGESKNTSRPGLELRDDGGKRRGAFHLVQQGGTRESLGQSNNGLLMSFAYDGITFPV